MQTKKELRKKRKEYKKVKYRISFFTKKEHLFNLTIKECSDHKNILQNAMDKLKRVGDELINYYDSEGLYPISDIYHKELFEVDRKVLIKKLAISDQIITIEGLKAQS